MAFSSLQFLCVFLPLVFLLSLIIPSVKGKNILLVIASLLFYAYGEPVYVILMLLCTLLNFIMALIIDGREGTQRKVLTVITCILNLTVLGIFKYTGMAVATLNSLLGLSISIPAITLPIGISFFTFQAMSYTVDIYRKESNAQRNFFKVLLYISLFPQLIAGPIVKYTDIASEIDERKASLSDIARGLRRFCLGLSKKVLISNTLALAADKVYAMNNSDITMLSAWIGAVSFMLQIYFDFSGYSDMAIGLGQMFGFHFRENFHYPYVSSSIQDFWRRWHISLSSWFKSYLYIPLGGNRKGRNRTWINRLIVFFCTGLWHGAAWTYVVWGLYHGLFLIIETIAPKFTKKLGVFRYVYVLLVVCIGFVFFRADSMGQAFTIIGAMFTKPALTAASAAVTLPLLSKQYIIILAVAIIGSLPIKEWFEEYLSSKGEKLYSAAHTISYVFSVILLFLCVCYLSAGTYNPFIYFRF